MATITLNYDARNKNISALLSVIMNLGAVPVNKPRKTGLDKALEDIKNGRVTRIKNVSNLLEECMQ